MCIFMWKKKGQLKGISRSSLSERTLGNLLCDGVMG